jgi:hypothetical protein
MQRVYHPVFNDFGSVVADCPRSVLILWDSHTVLRVTADLTIHHSHVSRGSLIYL